MAQSLDLTTTNPPCPIFYQNVTESVFKSILQLEFPITTREVTADKMKDLTYIEKNAVRYAAGYIPRLLFKTIKKSTNPKKSIFLLCLDDMLQDYTDIDTDDSQEWTELVDRGGLKHVSSEMYMVIVSMELELQKHLQENVVQPHFREEIAKHIIESEEVLFYWSILSAPWEDEDVEKELLSMVSNLWVTIRGFSYASAWIEKFKNKSKKTTQKSKGIRKTLLQK